MTAMGIGAETARDTDLGIDLGPGGRPDLWSGAVSWTRTDDAAWQPWRLRPEDEWYAHSETLYSRARAGAGVRLEAVVEGSALVVEAVSEDPDCLALDVVVDGRLARRTTVQGPTTVAVDLPSGASTVEVWLPHFGESRVRSVHLRGAGATASPVPPRAVRWVAYGSSITQCRDALGPTETWPALVARDLGWDLTCLGFGGNAHLDPVVPRAIAGLDADVVSLCVGINVQGGATLAERTFPGQVAELVRRVREAHPAVPIVLTSPITCPGREREPNAAGLTLADVRTLVERVGAAFRDRGDERVHVVHGPDLVGPDDAHLLGDGLHPDPDGYRLMARRIAPRLAAAVEHDARPA